MRKSTPPEPRFHVPDLPVDGDEVERMLAALPVPDWISYALKGNSNGEFFGTCYFDGKLRPGSKFLVDGLLFEAREVQYDPITHRYHVTGHKVVDTAGR